MMSIPFHCFPMSPRRRGKPTSQPVRDRRSSRTRRRRQRAVDRLEERCLLSTGSISGQVLDGTQPLAGVTVYLDLDRNEIPDPGEPSTTTDASGAYTFADLASGTYAVTQVPPDGFIQDTPAPLLGEALRGEILDVQPAPGASPAGMAWVNGDLHVVERSQDGGVSTSIFAVDPASWTVEGSIQVPGSIFDITHDGTSFWGADYQNQQIRQFDSAGNVIRQLPSPGSFPTGIAWDGESQTLWVLDYSADQIDQIDPADGAILHSFPAPDAESAGLDYDGTHLWLNGMVSRKTYALDPASGTIARSLDTPQAFEDENSNLPLGLAFDGASLRIAQNNSKQIFQVGLRSPAPRVVELTAASPTAGGVDFVDFRLGTISGTVFDDRDGVRSASEPGLDGWRAYLDTDGDGQFDSWEPTAATDASGSFTFTGVRDGSHGVGVVQRAPGWVLTSSPVQTATIAASGGTVAGIDFGQSLQDVGPVGTEFLVNSTTAGRKASSARSAARARSTRWRPTPSGTSWSSGRAKGPAIRPASLPGCTPPTARPGAGSSGSTTRPPTTSAARSSRWTTPATSPSPGAPGPRRAATTRSSPASSTPTVRREPET